jgi:hypothetical protein
VAAGIRHNYIKSLPSWGLSLKMNFGFKNYSDTIVSFYIAEEIKRNEGKDLTCSHVVILILLF